MKIISIWIALFLTMDAFAGAGVFPQGDSIKMIKNKLKFKDGKSYQSLAADPTSVAVDAPAGSIAVFSNVLYVKQDAGSTTNWLELTPTGLPLMAKGSIVTSNGTANGEFTACADGEILEWDSAEAAGIKCVPVPVSYKCQTKSLTATISATGVMSDLTFNNLTIGNRYRFFGKLNCAELTSTAGVVKGCKVYAKDGTTNIDEVETLIVTSAASVTDIRRPIVFNHMFVATAATLTFDAFYLNGGRILGDGSEVSGNKSITLCEVSGYTTTTDWL